MFTVHDALKNPSFARLWNRIGLTNEELSARSFDRMITRMSNRELEAAPVVVAGPIDWSLLDDSDLNY